jgi:hypothetical protein
VFNIAVRAAADWRHARAFAGYRRRQPTFTNGILCGGQIEIAGEMKKVPRATN